MGVAAAHSCWGASLHLEDQRLAECGLIGTHSLEVRLERVELWRAGGSHPTHVSDAREELVTAPAGVYRLGEQRRNSAGFRLAGGARRTHGPRQLGGLRGWNKYWCAFCAS